jgi:hypothetical protein
VLGGVGELGWLVVDIVTEIMVVIGCTGVVTGPPLTDEVGKHCEYQGFPACGTQVQPFWHRLGPVHPIPPHWPAIFSVIIKEKGPDELILTPWSLLGWLT